MSSPSPVVAPLDAFNQALLEQVHPPNWLNPTPRNPYDLVVIGAGTAGLVTALGTAGLKLGLKIALIEKQLLGGDCLNWGCVPSKCLIEAARRVALVRNAQEFGIEVDLKSIDFAAIMARMRRVRSQISHHDSVHRCQELGIDVFFGVAQFTNSTTLEVDGTALKFRRAVIATGAKPTVPAIPGLGEVGYLTNETIFSLTTLPPRLGIIGGGPIGCELGQAFQQFGSQVTIFQRGAHLLSREDPDVAAILQHRLQNEGVNLALGAQLESVALTPTGKSIHYRQGDQVHSLEVDQILVAVGRSPNVGSLNLAAAGIELTEQGHLEVNDYLQTRQAHIYAAGDVCLDHKFTHSADAAARIVIKNALFSPFGLGRSQLSRLIIPQVTYTQPELARVGLTLEKAQTQGLRPAVIEIPFSEVDRAIAAGEAEGMIRVIYDPRGDRILGAVIVGYQAGEMISQVTQTMVHQKGLKSLTQVIYPYPTRTEVIKKVADTYYQNSLLNSVSQYLLNVALKLTTLNLLIKT
ncbi:mercuric reductase [Candidatus Synechococcus calcipolaris]|uniref:mercuric reductase n=1 Tax=Candidatus Synechococcus calcipolaris TaxID=1522304 RepID=UPI0030CA1E0D